MIRKISALLLTLLIICAMPLSAFAEGPDTSRKGSITVKLRPLEEGQAEAAGVVVSLCRVGDMTVENSNLSYTLTGSFKGSNISLKDLNAPGLAEQLAAYAEINVISGLTMKTDAEGSAVFSGLTPGLYLAVQEGEMPGCLPVSPFLVPVPMTGPNGEDWIYDVEASPKVAPNPDKPTGGLTELSVWKSWADGGSHPAEITVRLMRSGKIYDTVVLNEANKWQHKWENLSPEYIWTVAEDVPGGYTPIYSSNGKLITIVNSKKPVLPENPGELTVKKIWSGNEHPDFVIVELWNGDTLYGRVKLSAENGWTHTWNELPKSDSWEIVETPVPNGYFPSYTVNGNTVTIKNSSVPQPPKEPDSPGGGGGGKPPLIQTGQLNWPVPLLAGGGVVLFALGWILCYMKGKKDHEA